MKQENNGFIEKTITNIHYHSKMKGCEIVRRQWKYISKDNREEGRIISGGYCKTHKKEICKCGWEWHWHYGRYSKPVHPELYQRIKRTSK